MFSDEYYYHFLKWALDSLARHDLRQRLVDVLSWYELLRTISESPAHVYIAGEQLDDDRDRWVRLSYPSEGTVFVELPVIDFNDKSLRG